MKKPDFSKSFLLYGLWPSYVFPRSIDKHRFYWVASQDIQNHPGYYYLDHAEKFIAKAVKSNEMPFSFDRSLLGTRLIKQNKLGEWFYKLLAFQNGSGSYEAIPFEKPIHFRLVYLERRQHQYEVSEYMKLLCTVANDLKLDNVLFSGNPLRPLASGLLEGDLINSLVFRLQEVAKTKQFKKKLNERQSEARKRFEKSRCYLESLYSKSASVDTLRLLLYHSSLINQSISLERSSLDFMRFLSFLENDLKRGVIVGWWWKREFMSELNFCYHLIIFFDKKNIKSASFNPESYSHIWEEITIKTGEAFSPLLVPEWGYQPYDEGWIQTSFTDSYNSIVLSIKRMLTHDIYMQLYSSRPINHFGMGPLPKAFFTGKIKYGI